MAKSWIRDISGGFAAALAGLPVELVYGLLAVAPLGAAYADHGLRAALWGCVLGGFLGLILRTTGGMIPGSRPAAGLILATLATTLLAQADIRNTADPMATVLVLLLACTALAGLCQWLFGLAGVGKALKYVPYPVIAGLMCGVGVLMAKSALKPVLGMDDDAAWSQWAAAWHPLALLEGSATLALCFVAPRFIRRIPGVLVALMGGSLLHHLLAAVVGDSHFGPSVGSTHGLIPAFSLWQAIADGEGQRLLHWLPGLLPYAAAIAAFASLESFLCLAAIESARHQRCDGNRELVRQGLANAVAGILGATPSIGNLSRVMVALSAGARTPIAGGAYALTLALIVLFAGQWTSLVPTSVTAGILLFYAQGMFDQGARRMAVQVFTQRRRMPPGQYKPLLGNFGVILLVALVAAIGHMMQALAVGVVAAMFLFVKSSMKPVIRQVSDAGRRRSLKVRDALALAHLEEHGHRIAIIDIDGPFFFGTADRASLEIEKAARRAAWVILDLRRVTDIDATGARTLLRIGDRLAGQQKHLLLCGMNEGLRDFLQVMGMNLPLHRENWFHDLDQALEVAEDELLKNLGVRPDTSSISLQDTALAEGLDAAQAAILDAYLVKWRYEAGDNVFRMGDTSHSLYMASEGEVDILIPLGGSKYKRVASFAPGNVFGEMALLEHKPRSADAVVRSPALIWELTQENLDRIRAEHPEIASQLMFNLSRILANRLRATTGELSQVLEAA